MPVEIATGETRQPMVLFPRFEKPLRRTETNRGVPNGPSAQVPSLHGWHERVATRGTHTAVEEVFRQGFTRVDRPAILSHDRAGLYNDYLRASLREALCSNGPARTGADYKVVTLISDWTLVIRVL